MEWVIYTMSMIGLIILYYFVFKKTEKIKVLNHTANNSPFYTFETKYV